jgi:signal transduction histidine kinase
LAATAEERARQAIEAERRRIARELHDIVAHSLSLMVLQAGAAEEIVKSDPSGAVEPLRTIQQTGRSALTDMKLLLGVLRGPEPGEELRPQPTLDDIADLVDQVRTTGLPVEMRVAGPSRPVGAGVALSAFRIVQEALTNVMKHAPDARVRVTIDYGEEALEVEVTNSAGISVGTMGSESGLRGMRERAELFGGQLMAGPIPDGGFRVHARFPLETSARS